MRSFIIARDYCWVGELTSGKRRMALDPFEQSERHVAEGERHVARQREIVASLKRLGRRWTTLRSAQEQLQTLELAQQFDIANRDGLRTNVAAGE
jgi:hypothetical protein